MDKYGYVLKQNNAGVKTGKRYRREELLLMTAFQLKEICRTEKIIQGVVNPMDKEELVRTILRFRGAEECFLIEKAGPEGIKALERVLKEAKLHEKHGGNLKCSSKIAVFEGTALGIYDGLTLPYDERIKGTNAFIAGGDMTLCAILNVVAGPGRDCLYLTRAAELPCRESDVKNYSLYCMGRRESEMLYHIYSGDYERLPEYLEIYRIPLLDFEVKQPVMLSMPMAMDFGAGNTVAGVYLDSQYFEEMGLHDGEKGLRENAANYAMFYDSSGSGEGSILLPSAVGVLSVEEGKPEFLFGYDAVRLAQASYIDEGFCVFYDIKRWIGDYEKQEEITDRQGRRGFVPRKEILRAYFEYVINAVKNRFKCKIRGVHISCPVKQKAQLQQLFAQILPDYALEKQDMVDEGVSVLYNTISEFIQNGAVQYGEEYRALIVGCGAGAADLCSCRFRVWDKRVSYRIEIDTAYENGDADFGGNNLTYRIMQLLKIALVNKLCGGILWPVERIIAGYDLDVFRYVDMHGTREIYRELEDNYNRAEQYIPTRFREFESRSRADYYKVKNNFYFLFGLAETVKKEFYNRVGTLRVVLSSGEVQENAAAWIPADKWKLSVWTDGSLEIVKEFPEVSMSIYDVELLLKADIYGIIRQFMERMYEENVLEDYSVIKLTGQSCKIDIFRDAIKEFVPGKTIRFKRRSSGQAQDYELKTACVEGALQYLKDKRYGYADVDIRTGEPALPYCITADTHSGQEVILIRRLERGGRSGMLSRNMDDLTLKLYLKDMAGNIRYQYTCESRLSDFEEKEYEEIGELYGRHIPQADTDDIVENEVKFFAWARPAEWGFLVVPVYRKEERLYLGKEERFYFENDGWVQNFYDGTK